MTRRRVLHLLDCGDYRGASIVRVFKSLVRGLDSSEWELHAWFLRGGGELATELAQAGLPVKVFDWRSQYDPAWFVKLARSLRTEEFDIVHQHGASRRNIVVRSMIRQMSRSQILLNPTGRVDESRALTLLRIDTSKTDAVVVSSKAVADCVRRGRPRVIPLGVPISSTSTMSRPRRPAGGYVLGTAARLAHVKGITYLLRAMAFLAKEFPGLRLEIAGCGSEQDALAREVVSLGLRGRVRFLGWVDPVSEAMRGWDIFVQPSLDEGFGLTAVEAMSVGLPVIASAVGGLLEVVDDGRTGLLVPPAQPIEIAGAVRRLLLDDTLREEMGRAGLERATRLFSEPRMVGEYRTLYEEMVCGS